ncbi:DUF58 domain-containing protein [Pseudohongiella spirulinae]|uniref:DUF58 domain-containing protein n=1 Tax=Pseudohongiella spirulinae TaxID=1249552 RepID=UPI0007177B2E|nr:DUF58 domain-containing protein [Pseudohongiella spirulinae]
MGSGLGQRLAGLRQRWQRLMAARQARWLARRVPATDSLKLSQRIIFILPTLHGTLFGLGAVVVLIIAIADRNSVALILALSMLSLFLLSLVLCYRNLSGLQLQAQTSADGKETSTMQRCYVGGNANFAVTLRAAGSRRFHQDLWLGFSNDAMQYVCVPKGDQVTLNLTTAATQRGLLSAPRLTLRTLYPMGLWQGWSRPDLAMRCLVYPQPQICALPANVRRLPDAAHGRKITARQAGVDDFAGLRSYQPGDSRRRIAWQTLARGQGLKTRQFVSEADPQVLLSFDQFPGRELESVLSCLCFQVLQLSRRGQAVGLKLPGQIVMAPAQGDANKHALLQALALFNNADIREE